jgi:hypothetical protein
MRVVDADAPEAALAWCTAHGLAAKNHGDDGLWLPDVAQVRNPRLVTALRAAVERLGSVIRERSAATGVLIHGDRARHPPGARQQRANGQSGFKTRMRTMVSVGNGGQPPRGLVGRGAMRSTSAARTAKSIAASISVSGSPNVSIFSR